MSREEIVKAAQEKQQLAMRLISEILGENV